jgi:hypothetical protein
MPQQLSLAFDEVPITCPVQGRYHAIAPVLADKLTARAQAAHLNLSYGQVAAWLREFRTHGLAGLATARPSRREPYTPERIVVSLLYWKCCAPRASRRRPATGCATRRWRHCWSATSSGANREFTDRIRYARAGHVPGAEGRDGQARGAGLDGEAHRPPARLLAQQRREVVEAAQRVPTRKPGCATCRASSSRRSRCGCRAVICTRRSWPPAANAGRRTPRR